ncbi:MAG: hypothetical protein WCI59_08325 [Betaproteobacteria bacterium]|jgi:hypothetical protein
MSPSRAVIAVSVLLASFSGSATAGVADVLATATVVQPASVMESFSLSMQLTATDRAWSSLKIIAPSAPAPPATGAASATGEGPQRNPPPGSAVPPKEPVPVVVATPTAFLALSGPQTGASTLLRGSVMATLQVTPAGVGALAEAAGVTRFIVVFN